MAKNPQKNKRLKAYFIKWINQEFNKDLFKIKKCEIVEFVFDKYLSNDKNLTSKQKENKLYEYFIINISETDFIQNKDLETKRKKIIKKVKKKSGVIINENDFYLSNKWLILKKKVLSLYKCGCMKCGAVDTEKHVDHIFPRSKFKYLEYNIHNLQILCRKCNMEKSNKNNIDYRTPEQKKLCSSKYN